MWLLYARSLSFLASNGNAQSTTDSMRLRVGDLVTVDPLRRYGRPDSEGGQAYVMAWHEEQQAADVQYIVGRRSSPLVVAGRMKTAVLATSGRVRNPAERNTITPSLISQNPRRLFPLPIAENQNTPAARRPSATKTTSDLVSEMARFNARTAINHPVLIFMAKMHERKGVGWLRVAEAKKENRAIPKAGSHLSTTEKQLVLNLRLCIKGTADPNNKTEAPVSEIARAWGVSRQTVLNIERRAINKNGMAIERKKRNDAGKTMLNNKRKVVQTITAKEVFLKHRRKETRGETISRGELCTEWDGLSFAQRQQWVQLSKEMQSTAMHLFEEVQSVLQRTRGVISWRQLAVQVAGGADAMLIVSPQTLMRNVMGLEDSHYCTTRIHPHLNECNKKRRLDWAHGFWKFWSNAKLFASKTLVVLAHMDEKWFYGIVVRRNNKCVPMMGVQAFNTAVHHKSHIPKVMGIATTMFVPHSNDMERGGVAIKVNLERVGRMAKAKKDSYKRVYRDDGSFHYPKLAENLLRRKGEMYFEALEVNGSSQGTEKNPKFSLLKYYNENEIPKLDAIAAKLASETGKKVVVRYQMDGAGPHQDKKLLEGLEEAFDCRGWHLKFQPANSPVTNVKDACIFPSMSKAVTQEQSLTFASNVMQLEEIWNTATKVWEQLPLETIARAYAGHHQMVNAIVDCNGGDGFARKTNGLHFGIRKHFVSHFSPGSNKANGVEVLENIEDIAHEDLEAKGLKYATPDVSAHKYLDLLNEKECDLLFDNLPKESMQWEELAVELLQNDEDII